MQTDPANILIQLWDTQLISINGNLFVEFIIQYTTILISIFHSSWWRWWWRWAPLFPFSGTHVFLSYCAIRWAFDYFVFMYEMIVWTCLDWVIMLRATHKTTDQQNDYKVLTNCLYAFARTDLTFLICLISFKQEQGFRMHLCGKV